jgi:hypothetical protein
VARKTVSKIVSSRISMADDKPTPVWCKPEIGAASMASAA